MNGALAVALDLGTTNIQGALLDLDKKKIVSQKSILNEQVILGDDVITRLGFAIRHTKNLSHLNRLMISSINKLIKSLVQEKDPNRIRFISAVGNSAIYHFTLNIDPSPLALAPFKPSKKELFTGPARRLGIRAGGDTIFEFLPIVDGFVGSDALAVIIAANLHNKKEEILAIDIGTNGEIIFARNGEIYVASTAAGPAFEGWHISCGMQARDGAVSSAELKSGKLRLRVTGGGKVKGICGSGLIDVVAVMLDMGVLNASGRLQDDFVIYADKRIKISVTQEDIRQVQLAKGAIFAAVNILMKHLNGGRISKLILTGKFGLKLNKENLIKIKLIPDVGINNIEFLENGALQGVNKFIFGGRKINEIDAILKKVIHVDLHKDKSFQDEFALAMRF